MRLKIDHARQIAFRVFEHFFDFMRNSKSCDTFDIEITDLRAFESAEPGRTEQCISKNMIRLNWIYHWL